MGIDLTLLQASKGGDLAAVRLSQERRFASTELVDNTLKLYTAWTRVCFDKAALSKQVNTIQKTIGAKMKAKEDAEELKAEKAAIEVDIAKLGIQAKEAEDAMNKSAQMIGNIVHDSVPVSDTEDDNAIIRTYHPDGPNAQVTKGVNILSHHEVMFRLDILEMERGAKVAGHRGFYLTGDGVDLNQALITYGLDFLRDRGFKKMQPPFFMNKSVMAKTAQLSEFDEALYKIAGDGEDNEKYLIATSEQPISAFHSDEWFDQPSEQLPLKYAGYSTCFRKEAGSGGRDVLGIFRIHQFEKVEQFVLTEPALSWEMFDTLIENSEAFYQSLGLPYQLISIVSGALNNAAAKKYDLEAWFPHQGEFKELVSVSNCTDYQSRTLEVRCGVKKAGEQQKTYVHMLNGTLCATERALCCVVENYQTPEGVNIPLPLQKYMQGRTFLPYVKEHVPKTGRGYAAVMRNYKSNGIARRYCSKLKLFCDKSRISTFSLLAANDDHRRCRNAMNGDDIAHNDRFDATKFNQSVYALVRRIPESKVTSYGAIARLLDLPHHARAVGSALKLLPAHLASPTLPLPPRPAHLSASQLREYVDPAPEENPLFVPWHRVLSSTGVISPRGNEASVLRQADWLRAEGVEVEEAMRENGGQRGVGGGGGGGEGVDAFGLGGLGNGGGRVQMKRYLWDGA